MSRAATASCCCTAARSSGWSAACRRRAWTLVPLDIHLRNGRAKVQLGIARGKKQYDKRETIAKRDYDREMQRAVKEMVR